MKKVLPFIFYLLLLIGCKTEKDAGPANENTFYRYYGSENSHTAKLALEDNNGYTLLSTVDIPIGALGDFIHKIRVIRTDVYGNVTWHKEFPSFEVQDTDSPTSLGFDGYKASSIISLPNSGYLIIGNRINLDESTDLQLLEIDQNGELVSEKRIRFGLGNGAKASLEGSAVTIDESGNYIVLGRITGNQIQEDMLVAQLNANLDSLWSRTYGDGISQPVNRIFTSENQQISWGASIVLAGKSDLRLIRTLQNSEGSIDASKVGLPEFNETAMDICESLSGYAIIGSTDNTQGDNDILVTRVSKKGDQLGSPTQINFDNTGDQNHQNDQGNSINLTDDGGFIILSTVESSTRGNGKKDYYLCKLDATGTIVWDVNYGGPEDEEGASVTQTSDGSYLVFGTTSFGNLKKLVLMKVNERGAL
jgi:hypothetical protein